MQKKPYSTFGYIVESLNIQTVSMSRTLHVDASLVSKWKTGSRLLTEKSVYFDDIITYLLTESKNQNHTRLIEALNNLYPQNTGIDSSNVESLLRQVLTTSTPSSNLIAEQQLLLEGASSISALIFENNAGKRAAISKLLDYAEAMNVPGEIVFIDSEAYDWFLENNDFSLQFTKRIIHLLHQGFHSKFVIHYSTYKEHFIHFFNACSPLIFHRNVDWYYYEYYDETLINTSFFILNRAVSLLSLSGTNTNSTTMVFTNNSLVLQHEVLADSILKQCSPIFTSFAPTQISKIVNNIYPYRRNGSFYSFLPTPAFISVDELLLTEILRNNNIDQKNINVCLALNNKLREATSHYFSKNSSSKDPFIHIFQLEELVKRAQTAPFISVSLTLLGGKSVKILPRQYAHVLRDFANGLIKHENLQVILVSRKDPVSLPTINCWCRKNSWMVQMDKDGFRSSEEISIVNAACATLERCIRRIPAERKEKDSVRQYLLELADSIDPQF